MASLGRGRRRASELAVLCSKRGSGKRERARSDRAPCLARAANCNDADWQVGLVCAGGRVQQEGVAGRHGRKAVQQALKRGIQRGRCERAG
eukprot:4325494-Pleurochrysis_carterae.AAC.1